MNNEDYVSLEVARLLKEKGYPDPKGFAATLYEAQKWLREKHNIDVLPTIREESPKKDYCCYIYKDAKVVNCKVAYGDDFYECMNDSLIAALQII